MDSITSIINKDFSHIHAISIRKHGKTIVRECFNGYTDQDLFKVGCMFKSIVSALVGIALKEKKILSLEQRMIDLYPEVKIKNVDHAFSLLTLQHVMTKTSGISWPVPGEKLPISMDEVWKLTFKDVPGKMFEYKPDPQIMIYLLEDLYKTDIISIAEEKLFQPLGIKRYQWDRNDIENLKIGVDELEKFGDLYLNRGLFHHREFFEEEFYKNSIKPYSFGGFPEEKPYGYFWWIDKYQEFEYFSACGFGGQKLCIVPSLNSSIIILSEMDRPHPENNAIIRNILPLLH